MCSQSAAVSEALPLTQFFNRGALFLSVILLAIFASNTVVTVQMLDGGLTPAIPILFASLFAMLLQPLLPLNEVAVRVTQRALPAIGLTVVFLIAVGTDYTSKVPKANSVRFAYDDISGESVWLSHSSTSDEWLSQFFDDFSNPKTMPHLTPSSAKLQVAPAPELKVAVPLIRLRSEKTVQENRILELEIESRRAVSCLFLWEDSATLVKEVAIESKSPQSLVRFSADLDKKVWRFLAKDQSIADFKLQFCGGGTTPFSLQLTVAKGETLRLRIVDDAPLACL